MKVTRSTGFSSNIVWFISVSIMFLLGSCAAKSPFLTSSVLPAARGHVNVKQDKNNNYVIKLELTNLAEPERLQPPKKTYVVWMVGNDNIIKNLGLVKTSTNMLSSNLKASFETKSPVKPTKIFLTAEDDAAVQYPSSEIVLTTASF